MDTSYAGSIRRQIEEAGLGARISLLGTVSDQDLAVLLPQHHLLAVPSSYEGFGIVYLEGMHFGLPAIAGTIGAAKELVRHGHNGFLAPAGRRGGPGPLYQPADDGPGAAETPFSERAGLGRGPSHLGRERRPGPGPFS